MVLPFLGVPYSMVSQLAPPVGQEVCVDPCVCVCVYTSLGHTHTHTQTFMFALGYFFIIINYFCTYPLNQMGKQMVMLQSHYTVFLKL